jgi:hypothetical protein
MLSVLRWAAYKHYSYYAYLFYFCFPVPSLVSAGMLLTLMLIFLNMLLFVCYCFYYSSNYFSSYYSNYNSYSFDNTLGIYISLYFLTSPMLLISLSLLLLLKWSLLEPYLLLWLLRVKDSMQRSLLFYFLAVYNEYSLDKEWFGDTVLIYTGDSYTDEYLSS